MKKLHDSEFMQLDHLDANTQTEEIASLFKPSEFHERVFDLREHGRDRGAFKPYWDQWGDKFVIRPKELSIFFGARGSYKSTVVNYLIADYLMKSRDNVGLISYEMEPEDLLFLLAEQMSNSITTTDDYMHRVMDLAENRITMIDEMVDSPHSAIGKINSMLERGCKLVILDCLQRVNMPANNIDLEREFVVEITNMVRKHDAHAIVVHHSRKGSHSDGDNPMPVVDDLKGSGGLADNAHNVVAVWSNKKKKDLAFKISNGYVPDDEELELMEMADIILDVKKQRKGIFEGKIGLWRTESRAFHKKGQQPNVF